MLEWYEHYNNLKYEQIVQKIKYLIQYKGKLNIITNLVINVSIITNVITTILESNQNLPFQ